MKPVKSTESKSAIYTHNQPIIFLFKEIRLDFKPLKIQKLIKRFGKKNSFGGFTSTDFGQKIYENK